jgi:hypothetical protein
MSTSRAFDRPSDPLYHTVPLHHALELPMLGVTVRFESNSSDALAAVDKLFGGWRGLFASPELIDAARVRVRVIVHDGDEGPAPHAPVVWRLPDPDRLLIHTPGSVGLMDMRRRDAVVYVTPGLLADRAHFDYAVLHTITLPLVDTFDRYPVHAALIARGSVGLLLAGPSGTGKSTLAFEAHRSGLSVLSDDACHIQLKPVFRAWGELPGQVYLTPGAGARYPELARQAPSLVANSVEKLFVEFPYSWSGPGGRAPMASVVGVCLLARDGGVARTAPATPEEITTFLRQGLGVAEVMLGRGLEDALASVAAGGGWKLWLSDDPAEAVPLLLTMLTALARRD